MIPDLLDQLKNLASAIRRSKAININSKTIKESAIATGSCYFKECRTETHRILGDDKALAKLDEDWQQLIRLAHTNNAKKSYLSLLKKLLEKTTELAVLIHSPIAPIVSQSVPKLSYSQAEEILISTLEQLVPSAAQSYRQGLQDLRTTEKRFSFKGTACELRETLREILDNLAPDNEVRRQSWFKQEPDCNGPTMKQKVRYIMMSRGKNKAQRTLTEKSIDLIENPYGDVTRAVYNRASLSTHVETTKQEVSQMKRYLDAVLFDILEIGQNEQTG
jgi:hypothetical protein